MAHSKEDWDAAMNSEVFREYLKIESMPKKLDASTVDEAQILEDFDKFEESVKNNPKIKLAFQTLQKKFKTDPEYTEKVDPKFVKGVMLLDLSENRGNNDV